MVELGMVHGSGREVTCGARGAGYTKDITAEVGAGDAAAGRFFARNHLRLFAPA
eukprot:gene9715-4155_t